MSLYRRLLLIVLLAFSLLFIGVYGVQFKAIQHSVAAQQDILVMNSLTALGLALTPYLESGDARGAESVVNTVFEGGGYKEIQLELLASDTHIRREYQSAPPSAVPGWFRKLQLLPAAQSEVVLTSGWLQLGRLSVVGQTRAGEAYLWQLMSRQALWFAGCFLLLAVTLAGLMAWILRRHLTVLSKTKPQGTPLTQSPLGVASWGAGAWVSGSKLSGSKLSCSKLSGSKLSGSKLGGRAYFITQTQSWLNARSPGAVLLVALDWLAHLDKTHGVGAREARVNVIVSQLRQLGQGYGEYACAQLSACEFILLIPEDNKAQLLRLGNDLRLRCSELAASFPSAQAGAGMNETSEDGASMGGADINGAGMSGARVGIVIIGEQESVGKILRQADNALSLACMTGTIKVLSGGVTAAQETGRATASQAGTTASG